jgi:hypothetical protein
MADMRGQTKVGSHECLPEFIKLKQMAPRLASESGVDEVRHTKWILAVNTCHDQDQSSDGEVSKRGSHEITRHTIMQRLCDVCDEVLVSEKAGAPCMDPGQDQHLPTWLGIRLLLS